MQKKIKNISKGGTGGNKPVSTLFTLKSTTYFLTYRGRLNPSKKGSKLKSKSDFITKQALKNFLFDQCKINLKAKPEKYLICEQMYDSGEPHFHVILVYPKRKVISNQYVFDYLGIHPNIQTMRNMKAALNYVYKEDPNPLTNMDVDRQMMIAKAKNGSSLYQLLLQQMIKDPFRFDVAQYFAKNNLCKYIYKTNYTKAVSLIKMMQPAYARQILRNKPGIKFITPALIKQRLSHEEYKQYYAHECYQRIINHVNQIHTYPNRDPSTKAPSKTPHLLIVGDTSIGKSALVDHVADSVCPYPGLMHYYSCYHMSIGQKFFPPYRSFDYCLVRWNEFTIASDMFPKSGYNRLLDYLEGAPSALPQKGSAPVERQDNPKHILTSNRTLQQHICKTFTSESSRAMSRKNLGTRIDCVNIPEGKSIHFLRKLFVSN